MSQGRSSSCANVAIRRPTKTISKPKGGGSATRSNSTQMSDPPASFYVGRIDAQAHAPSPDEPTPPKSHGGARATAG